MADISCTAVLIVRDEETVVEECLRSVRPLVDEIVVLDTGSRDRTPELAAAAGARVVQSGWRDDFAAARNEALAHARGDWIMSIDADERVVRGSRRDLAPLRAAGPTLAFGVWLRPGAGFTPYRHCRLFRRDPRIRFEGRIRESVLPSIRRMAAVPSRPPVGDCDVRIEHQDGPAIRRRKHERDLSLLRQALEDDGDSVVYWTDLARALDGLGELDEALRAWDRAIALARRHGVWSAPDSLPFTDVIERTAWDDQRRRALLDEARARFPDNRLLVWLCAETLLAERRYSEAEPLLRQLEAIDGDRDAAPELAYDRRIFEEFAYGALAACCFGLSRWAEAADWYGRASTAQPASVEYRVKRVLALGRSRGSRDSSAPAGSGPFVPRSLV
jgi:tetratricopeptide (TPR) repeat protein